MATIDRSLLRTGFDVELLVTGRYLQALLVAAYDAGVIPITVPITSTDADGEEVVTDTVVLWQPRGIDRLYPPLETTLADGGTADRWETDGQFAVEIVDGDPRGAQLRVAVTAGTFGQPLPAEFHAVLGLHLVTTAGDGALTGAGLAVTLLDIDAEPFIWTALASHGVTKDDLIARVGPRLDRTIDLRAVARGQRVEQVEIRWLPAADAGQPVLAVLLNLHLRTTDAPGGYLAARGNAADAVNFLPIGQDVAVATRPGLYDDLRLDTWSRLASPAGTAWDHPLRTSLLDPDSERVGDVTGLEVRRIPPRPLPGGTVEVQNGLRLRVDAHYVASAPATTDVVMSVDLRPEIDADGLLVWHTDLDVDVDAVFEWFTGWVVGLAGIAFGPLGAGVALGAVVATGIGAGIYLGEHFDTRVHERVDATLNDVVQDRLTVATVRWDPFYATAHQVVVRPEQAEFDDDGFALCGTVVVGRELVPPLDTVLVRPLRDAAGDLAGLAYRVPGPAVATATAPGTHRREFPTVDPVDPEVHLPTLDQLRARRDDPDGPLVLTHLPYFPATVHVVDHQIAHLMGIAASQLATLRRVLRTEWKVRLFAEVESDQGAAIRAAVVAELSAGGATPTEDEIGAEVETRIQAIVDGRAAAEFTAPPPLDMVRATAVRPLLSFDLTPREWLQVRDEQLVDLDPAVRAVHGDQVSDHLRDRAGFGDPTDDNLLERPRYTPGPDGPVFRD